MCGPPPRLTGVKLLHLQRRFFGSLRPGGPGRDESAWVASILLPGEWALWRELPGPDRRHSAAVARRVAATLGADAARPVLAAALLHDVGKLSSGLRTPGRVAATILGATAARDRQVAEEWRRSGGWRGRFGSYLCHPEIGAELLDAAGSDPVTIAWTREHHLPPDRCTLDPRLADALRSADDD